MKRQTLQVMALLMGAASLCQATTAKAAAPVAQEPAKEAFSFCKWLPNTFKLFNAKRDGAENKYIQEFNVGIRAQYQWGYVDPSGGSDAVKGGTAGQGRNDNNEWRRVRLGMNAKFLNRFKAEMTWNIGGLEGRNRFSGGKWSRSETAGVLDVFYVEGTFEPVAITVGKFKPAYMGEYRTSSARIKTIERSAIVDQLKAEKLFGLAAKNSDKKAKIGWEAGVWINGQDGDDEFTTPHFNSDASVMFGGNINFETGKNSRLQIDYMHSFADIKDGKVTSDYAYAGPGARDVLAATWAYKEGDFSFNAEAIAGFGVIGRKDADNVYGLILMPSYRLSPRWEAVARYQISAGSNAVAESSRYYTTNAQVASACDFRQAFYVGANLSLCPDSPDTTKLMFGMEYVNSHGTDTAGSKGFTGWSFSSAVRVNF